MDSPVTIQNCSVRKQSGSACDSVTWSENQRRLRGEQRNSRKPPDRLTRGKQKPNKREHLQMQKKQPVAAPWRRVTLTLSLLRLF